MGQFSVKIWEATESLLSENQQLATKGLGIAYLPSFALGGTADDGGLVTLLDKYQSESSPIGAVYLEGRTLPRKVRALIDFSVNEMKSQFSDI